MSSDLVFSSTIFMAEHFDMTNASFNSDLIKQVSWRILAGLLLNILIVILYTSQVPPDRKMGYFFAVMTFGFAHLMFGLAVVIFRLSARSIFSQFTMMGNLLFALYFSGFMVDYSQAETSIYLVIPALSLLLGLGLAYRGYRDLFQSNRESL